MTTALDTVSKLTVTRMNWAPNQARTLEAIHDVKVTDGAALPAGTVVSYTDPDLGYVFFGKIVSVSKAYADGEGLRYSCSDAYRTLVKQTAAIATIGNDGRSSRIKFEEGTDLGEAIDAVLAEQQATLFPGGVDKGTLSGITPLIDKGGQKIDTWLDDLLEVTDSHVAWVDPNSGTPKFVFKDYNAQPSITLVQGTYNIIPISSGDLVLQEGKFGESLNDKYKSITLEGGGRWLRHEEEYIDAELTFVDEEVGLFQYRWYVPDDKKMTCVYIEDGQCVSKCLMRLKVGDGEDAIIEDVENPAMGVDDDGRQFFFLNMKIHGTNIGGGFAPPQVEAWFDYTTYEGPLLVTKTSTDPKLDNEGELWEQHPEYCLYEDEGGIVEDPTTLMQAMVDALFERFSNDADEQGSVSIHVKGLDPDLQPGSKVSNFNDMQVRQLTYDLVGRTIRCELSGVPLRGDVKTVKQRAKDLTLERNNWYQNRSRDKKCCFNDNNLSDIMTNENGDPIERDSPETETFTGYECQMGDCVEVTADSREEADRISFRTLEDCQRVCGTGKGYRCVSCEGCIQTEQEPEFATEDECLDFMNDPLEDCTPPGDASCKYNCKANGDCVQAANGAWDTLVECQDRCFPFGSGPGGSGSGGVDGSGFGSGVGGSAPASTTASGGGGKIVCCGPGPFGTSDPEAELPPNKFVNCVVLDKFGHVQLIYCSEASGIGGGGSGFTGTIEVVCNVSCSGDILTVEKRTLDVNQGSIVDPGTCE
jgi:hypothetical protein